MAKKHATKLIKLPFNRSGFYLALFSLRRQKLSLSEQYEGLIFFSFFLPRVRAESGGNQLECLPAGGGVWAFQDPGGEADS